MDKVQQIAERHEDIEKFDGTHVEDQDTAVKEHDLVPAQWDPKFVRRIMWKMDLLIMPIATLLYLFASLDKSNLGNAKELGMITDIGGDKTGDRYALLNSMYFIAYAPLLVPAILLCKRWNTVYVITCAGIIWGTAATCFAAVNSFGGAFACRFFVGVGEAGFGSTIPFYLARWYTRGDLASRTAIWLCAAPMGGFFNGIIAYGVSFIHSHLASWRILFLIEGLLTVVIACLCFFLLPDDIPTARWFTPEEKEYLMWRRSFEMSQEKHEINWKHARGAVYRWQQLLPSLAYQSQVISGMALAAFLPTFTKENGFTGANAQIATLAPYGSAAVFMIALSWLSDKQKNRALYNELGFVFMIVGFGIYLWGPTTNHAGRFAALVLAESGHYIVTPLLYVWLANNSGSESRRAVAMPLMNACGQAISIGAGYLFPKRDSPKYTKGSASCVALSVFGLLCCFAYQFMIVRENKKRDAREGKPAPDHRPDTATFADEAPGFRYQI